MQMTKHFHLSEFTRSGMAATLGIDQSNPPPAVVERLAAVAQALERFRALAGVPLRVHSGWRCQQLNRLVGGVPASDHLLGWAADVSAMGLPLEAFVERLRAASHRQLGAFDQLIVESSRGVLHASFNPRFRGEWLRQDGGPKSPVSRYVASQST